MIIQNLKNGKNGNRVRVSASVSWEDCSRPDYEVYFEVDEAFGDDLACNPDAFLLACSIPAMHYGEKRVFIDAEICPELHDGLATALGWLSHWYGQPRPRLEFTAKRLTHDRPSEERAGFFFSGGIDSFATLCRNRLNFPPDHPRSIRDGLLVFGLEQDIPEIFEYVKDHLEGAAREAGVTLITVYTNIYLPFRQEDSLTNFDFWNDKFVGGALASVAHVLSPRFSEVEISSDFDIPNLSPDGSHPLLVPNYGSADLRIRYGGTDLSRFERTRLLVEWGLPLPHLRICNKYKQYQPGHFNCGKCEKCVRTMMTLVALGALDKTEAFAVDDVTPEMLSAINICKRKEFHHELLEPLHQAGRDDLVRILKDKIHNDKLEKNSLFSKEGIKDLDNRYLHGSLRKLASLGNRTGAE